MEILKFKKTNHHFLPNILFRGMFKIYVFLFLLISPFAKPLTYENTTFKFSRFDPKMDDIIYEGDAKASNQVIQLAIEKEGSGGSFGRAIYRKPIKLWDNASGNLADFNTYFSFLVDSRNILKEFDGFAFFLTPTDSQLLSTSGAGNLGLVTSNPAFVAVEFDSYANELDMNGGMLSDHVGIDVNSMRSVNAVEWSWSDVTNGQRAKAWISSNSTSKNLSVIVTDDSNSGTSNFNSLSYIVDLKEHLPELVNIGFSGATGYVMYEIYNIISWDFSSTLQIAENVTNFAVSGRKKNKTWLWVVLGVGACSVVPALIWFGYWMSKNRMKTENNPISADNELARVEVPRMFSYKELVVATNNFSDEGLLGEGGFGQVYKGFLNDTNSNVAVKKIIPESRQGMKEYVSEVKSTTGLRHRNLVKLIGWCHDKEKELLIVYDFMPNKSLDFHIFKEERLLTWEERHRIVLGLASAMIYMQEECEHCVMHRDIKSSNVLLDMNFNAWLGDFGLARLIEHGQVSQTTDLLGTPGYMAPEYFQNSKATKESDIYSFGIVALEIACGKRATEQGGLVKMVWGHYGSRNVLEVADPRLGGEYDADQMERLIIVGLWCSHLDYNSCPSMRDVMDVLNSKAPLPVLPPIMPVSTFIPPPLLSSSSGASGSERGQTQYSGNSCNTDSSKFSSSTASGGT